MSTRRSSVNKSVLFVVVVLLPSTMFLLSLTATSLVRASLVVKEQATSSSDNNADKEIASISFGGSPINVNKPEGAAHYTAINDTTLSASRSEPTLVLNRGRRYLDLLETTRMFFRVNAKNNIVPKPVIWAHGYGLRCNYPIENARRARPFRRDTYETLGDLIDKIGFDGKACILKAFCAAHMQENTDISSGMLFKLFKYIFALKDDEKRHLPYLKYENCHQILHSHCPLSFNSISPFTDDV